MSKEKIWLSSPHIREREQELVNNAFATNWIAPVGPHVNGFEEDIRSYSGARAAAALSSGTAALHLAMVLSDVGPGDLVFVPSMTFSATINPIIYQGGIPVFVDADPDTWNMSPTHLEEAIQAALDGSLELDPKVLEAAYPSPSFDNSNGHGQRKALQNKKSRQRGFCRHKPHSIMPVHLYGMPADMDAILEIAEKYKLTVIEDAAESLGSTYKGRHTGTLGKMGAYSFNGNKIITTSGGGALVSNDEQVITKARYLATQARDQAPHYQHSEIGYNYRLSNVLAGIGRGQMEVLDENVRLRRRNFKRYHQYFEKWNELGFDIKFQQEPEGSFSNRWLSCILVDPANNFGLTRERIRLALAEENIESRPLWKPMHKQPVFSNYPHFGDGTADNLFDIGLCLPSSSHLSGEEFSRISCALNKLFRQQLELSRREGTLYPSIAQGA